MAARRLASAAIASSNPHVAEVVSSLLPKANAIDLVVAGVLAAAALSPSVLLGPVQILLGGVGSGLRAIDGRNRQPGAGVPRPRGFLATEEIPEAARVAVPALPAALGLVHALGGDLALSRVVAPALALAKKESEERRDVLERVGRRGASALSDPDLAGELVAAAGRLRGGLVTPDDLAAVRPVAEDCVLATRGNRAVARAPWAEHAVPAGEAAIHSATHLVAAADARGRFAIASYDRVEEGLEIPALGLLAPRQASPVLRGATRVRPGEPRPASCPAGLFLAEGVLQAAVGFAGNHGDAALEEMVEAYFGGLPIEASNAKGAACTGVLRTPTGARPFHEPA